mgnify:CR=1 FL=1
MIAISDIREIITQAQADHVMGIVKQAKPNNDDYFADIISAVDDIVSEDNLTDSGYDMIRQVRDFRFEDDDFILEVELPA